MASAMGNPYDSLSNTSSDSMDNSYDSMGNTSYDFGDLPTLLSSNAHIQRQGGQAKLFLGKTLADKQKKGFVDGDRVEYYSKSYSEWVPAIINDVRPNGCLKLLHDDGSVLKNEADPNSVRLAREQGKPGHDKQVKFDISLGDCTLAMSSQAASGIRQANTEQSSSKAIGSKEAYDQQMKFLHSRSEKCDAQLKAHRGGEYDEQMKLLHSRSENSNAQLKAHRGLSEGMAQDQQLELSHLEFRHSLINAKGPDMANPIHSSDELMRQMNFRHGLSSMCDQQLKLDRSLSVGLGS
jgi:hypothetical protein